MGKYDDILHLPHHVSETRPHMSIHDRAAQFAPFAALSGYGDAVTEAGRYTGERAELDECAKAMIDLRLQALVKHADTLPEVCVAYFAEDGRKFGGQYTERAGHVRRIDKYEQVLELEDGTIICIDDIISIDSPLFRTLEGFE